MSVLRQFGILGFCVLALPAYAENYVMADLDRSGRLTKIEIVERPAPPVGSIRLQGREVPGSSCFMELPGYADSNLSKFLSKLPHPKTAGSLSQELRSVRVNAHQVVAQKEGKIEIEILCIYLPQGTPPWGDTRIGNADSVKVQLKAGDASEETHVVQQTGRRYIYGFTGKDL